MAHYRNYTCDEDVKRCIEEIGDYQAVVQDSLIKQFDENLAPGAFITFTDLLNLSWLASEHAYGVTSHFVQKHKPQHGGKREGAGRPRMVKYERARPISVTLTRKQHEALKDLLHVMSEHEPVGEHNREKLSKLNRSQMVGACIELVHSKVAGKRGTDLELRDDLTLFL